VGQKRGCDCQPDGDQHCGDRERASRHNDSSCVQRSDDEDYEDQQDRKRGEQRIPQPILQVSEVLFAISIDHCI
jgi:hypothetical protein